MEVNFEFTPEQAQQALREAIEKQLTPEVRDSLIKQSLEYLIKKDYMGTSPNGLQQAFKWGAERVAREVFEEEFAKPEVRAKIRDLVVDSFDRIFADPDTREIIVGKVSGAIGEALTSNRFR